MQYMLSARWESSRYFLLKIEFVDGGQLPAIGAVGLKFILAIKYQQNC